MKPISGIRGMNDVLPKETPLWQYAEHILSQMAERFGYHEIRFPVLEKTELFLRSVGDHTDIVQKEMYTFPDRSNENLSLRPEGTACCVRAGIEHGLLHNQTAKLWYHASFFRYERPQKGRYRQFHQFGAEMFGLATADSDAELIMLSHEILRAFNLNEHVQLELNSLGSPQARTQYKEILTQYFSKYKNDLNEDEQLRLTHNPLRLLDSKNPALNHIILEAPKLIHHLDEESKIHFESLKNYLSKLNIQFTINPNLVRGLDYYTKTVFEWTTNLLGAQNAVCSGGRYDGLVEKLGGQATPALGFGLGIERLILLLSEKLNIKMKAKPKIYFITDNDNARMKGMSLAQQVRNHCPDWCVLNYLGNQSIKHQFKKADQSGADIACIIGENELKENTITIKHLRLQMEQISLAEDNLIDTLNGMLQNP